MTDRPIAAPANYNCLVKVLIRACDTDARVFEDTFHIFADNLASYLEQTEDLHQLIRNIASSYTEPVYISERVIELTTDIPRAQRRLQ